MTELYDSIGAGYRDLRRPDARIRSALERALDGMPSVVNVGAGTGSYEPLRSKVVAVEPSRTMIEQRSVQAAPAVQASATALPFSDAVFGAALAILTVHHWPDRARGLDELARVARGRVVLLTWDPAAPGFWLTDYFPEILAIDRAIFPSLAELHRAFGRLDVHTVRIPHDCSDGFLGAYWRRPHAYLDARVRSAISTFTKLEGLEAGLARLRTELANGDWAKRYGALLDESELDLGYRLVVAV